MELRQLRHFITVAETLNYHRAAERLNMTQPPLSVSIRKLEEEIGTSLFDRALGKVKLTQAGHAALKFAREAVQCAEEAGRAARTTASGETGQIKLAFAGSATYRLLHLLIPLYRRRYPNVKMELREATNTQIVAMLEADEIDIGLARDPANLPRHIEIAPVENDVLCAAIPDVNPLSRRPRIVLGDMADEPFILHARSGKVDGLHSVVTRLLQEVGVRPRTTQEAVHMHTVISLVEAGLGVALVPSVCSRYTSPKVVFKQIDSLPPSGATNIALLYRPESESPASTCFRAVALETSACL